MRILVCVKHVPDTTEVRFDSTSGELKVRQAPTKINNYDEHALEAAVNLRESTGAEVVIASVGPAEAAKTMKGAVAAGGDRAVLVTGEWAADLDAAGAASVLAAVARSEGPFDLVLSGDVSEDGYHSLVPGLVAAELDLPFVRGVSELAVADGKAVVTRQLDDVEERYSVTLPAALSVTSSLNTPRAVTTLQIMKVAMSKVVTRSAAELELDETSLAAARAATRVIGMRPAAQPRRREVVTGETDEIVKTVVAKLEEAGVLA